ncbi:hypothetical protein [Fictibacillus sp. 18YEL24]|uniref:hypothetical protein n=1 Tax=Fictibacillus sp. 18YEL24 TaxID=2745875 RepID=UPI0018CF484A|nr:hypothetical protein [Fictibacillus sp. 18YEL24]MBH0169150.1 hypothetical protein [Fictibacillus sp. 18YEL24]
MIRLENGLYICHLNGYTLKVVYLGSNVCAIYLDDQFQGKAQFDYVKKKLNQMEKRWDTSKVIHYQYRELTPMHNYRV